MLCENKKGKLLVQPLSSLIVHGLQAGCLRGNLGWPRRGVSMHLVTHLFMRRSSKKESRNLAGTPPKKNEVPHSTPNFGNPRPLSPEADPFGNAAESEIVWELASQFLEPFDHRTDRGPPSGTPPDPNPYWDH